nr:hypothetical protein L204_05480 [Cryptococcus depauperatus CBS 7855]
MAPKRKREHTEVLASAIARPKAGTKAFASGKAVKDALATGSPQVFISFRQQIVTPYSQLPLALLHPAIVILQQYLEVSPTCDEIFRTWQIGYQAKSEQQIHPAVELLSEIINVLTPIPFFRSSVVNLANKIISNSDPYHDYINYLIQSGKRDDTFHGLLLASAAISVDPPAMPTSSTSMRRTLGIKVWNTLVDGGSVRGLGKQIGMRRRNKEGAIGYGDTDPYDKPDIRHLILRLILPVLSQPSFFPHAKAILPQLYSNLSQDPPITVYRVLSALWSAIEGPNASQNRKIALVLFQEKSIEALWEMLGSEDKEKITGKTVSELVSAFLKGITAIPGKGICFPDEGWYLRRVESKGDSEKAERNDAWHQGLHNRILGNVVRKVGNKVIGEDSLVGNWILKVLNAAPELVSGYWPYSALSLEPQLSTRWVATMAYVGRIVSLPPPDLNTFRQPALTGSDRSLSPFRLEPPQTAIIVESILPAPLTKSHLMKGLQHTYHLVQHMTALVLSYALIKLSKVLEVFRYIEMELYGANSFGDNSWAKGIRALEVEIRKRMPELGVIVAFAQKSVTLAPAEPETEEELALATRSAMLTELALRLFALCNHTLPSMASEMRFDPGRLLVSSSAKAEKREARAAREGSVLSDSGSVKSVGTVGSAGTAGMGGGFGSGKGNVKGWEALCQVHVVSLLGEVTNWDWSKKAAGSQFTYLYHILLLHLTTPISITQTKTSELLSSLLLPTLLFSHDANELTIWLEALPKGSREANPMLFAQQIYLLSFLDDCFRRCLKTPYRYIEELSSFFLSSELNSDSIPSPLVVTILEQLRAKILGQFISSEAACIVVNYLRRVMLGLVGKQGQGNVKGFISIAEKLEGIVIEAKEQDQTRFGLTEVVQIIRDDLDVITGTNVARSNCETYFECLTRLGIDLKIALSTPSLLDEKEWLARSFEGQAINGISPSLEWLIPSNGPTIKRIVQFLLCLRSCNSVLLSPVDSRGAFMIFLSILSKCLDKLKGTGKWEIDSKRAIFDDPAIRALILSHENERYPTEVKALIERLEIGKVMDEEIASGLVEAIVELFQIDKKGKLIDSHLSIVQPWISFLSSSQATSIVERLLSVSFNLSQHSSILSQIVIKIKSPEVVVNHLEGLCRWGVTNSIVSVLNLTQSSQEELTNLFVHENAIKQLFYKSQDEGYELLKKLTTCSTSAAGFIFAVIVEKRNLAEQGDVRIVPIVDELLKMNFDFPDLENIGQLALDVIVKGKEQISAINILVSLALTNASAVSTKLKDIQLQSFNPACVLLAKTLAPHTKKIPELRTGVIHLVNLGLQYAVRVCSDLGSIKEENTVALNNLTKSVCMIDQDNFQQNVAIIEPIITTVVQDRLDVTEAVELAALLASRVELKASFLRQQLQALFSSRVYTQSTLTSFPPPLRLSFIHLLHAIFCSSTYVSCQPSFIEPLISLYRGTMSEADRRVLHMLQQFEGYRRVSIGSLMHFWNGAGVVGIGNRVLDALTSLDSQKVFATCQNFPLRRQLRGWGESWCASEQDESIYDPVFVMGLLAQSMHEGMRGLDWVEALRSNVLGLTVSALSSRDRDVRSVAGYILAKVMKYIETTPFYERAQLRYTLHLLRHSISTPGSRLPTLTTLYFAHALRSLASPSHFLYPLSSRFLLQRPIFDINDTPMLYSMLYAHNDGWKRERGWIVRFLKDGVRSESDWRVIKRRNVWTLLSTIFIESLDPGFRLLVLQASLAMSNILLVPSATSSLVLHDGLFIWISMQWATITKYHASLPLASRSGIKGQRTKAWQEQEKDMLLEMAERACRVMSHTEKQRLQNGAREVRGWVTQVETFVKTALEGEANNLIL